MERPASRSSHGQRTASRSSTSTNNTKVSMHTAHTSNSHPPGSPAPSHAHRFYHATCERPSSTTPRTSDRTSRLTREASSESTRQPAMSSFLQEKLRESRRVESDKSSTWSRSHTANSSGEFSRSLGSPVRVVDSEHRSHSPASTETSKKKGMGVMDMEQVISSLHKKNFDLKLELYHRRERQTALEDKVEALEMEKSRTEEMNHHLSQEMEKRDKAIEEAVAMIVSLEARLEEFVKERSIIEQIQSEGQYSAHNFNPCYEDPRPATQTPVSTKRTGDDRIINRMPSFISDHSENTENLRNVYLGARGSVLSLAQVPEGPGEGDTGRSPSLSILSESSFVSVYGSKEDEDSGLQEEDESMAFDGSASLPARASAINRPKTAFVKSHHSSPNRSIRSKSISNHQAQFDSIHNVIEYSSSRQRTERHHSSSKMGSRPQSRDQDVSERFTGRASMSPSHQHHKQEKRDSLRRVTTEAPGGVRLHDQNLPPTPDTVSTSTLRRFNNSNEALLRPPTARPSHSALSEASENDGSLGTYSGVRLEQPPMRAVKASAHIIDLNNRVYRENQGRSIQRPRSADETTISNRRGNDWNSDIDDDSDVESLESSIDIWMRQSSKPIKNNGRASPDLFSFPPSAATKGGWAMDAMFGAGNSHQGGASTGLDPDRIRDLFPVQQELFSSSMPPPPPDRRSSLNPQVAQQSKPSFLGRPLANTKASKGGRKKGHQRRNSDDIQIRAGAHMQTQGPSAGDKNHYPPIAGQQPTQNKFTKFFRRSSTGPPSGAPTPTPRSEHGPTEPPNGGFSSPNGASGLPPWMSRTGVLDEDRDSATPPPIMRKSRQGRNVSVDIDMADDSRMGQESGTPGTPKPGQMNERDTAEQIESPRAAGATGSRRKWLPAFGLRNKQG
ncbi:hypothetical protein FPOAC2_07061 [Fusarium poae]|uniref:hypothetical protein n=1 Tax=Fusarium poae TaxID=36050 RepID=UPI001CE97BF6|nr:hypothetical protein FPOAC1_006928 [Fusarium poae]KAG8673614.1 hypothetical protein FPOAC1_006928 [Fusarium poae]